jgi:hypothetical protein
MAITPHVAVMRTSRRTIFTILRDRNSASYACFHREVNDLP